MEQGEVLGVLKSNRKYVQSNRASSDFARKRCRYLLCAHVVNSVICASTRIAQNHFLCAHVNEGLRWTLFCENIERGAGSCT